MPKLHRYSLQSLADVLRVPYDGEDQTFNAVNTDTRKVQAGDLFVALKGPSFDGHDFLDQALEKGAVAALVDRPVESKLPQIQVDNTLNALGILAKARREVFAGKLIGLTGSNGKTTVKELTAAIFGLKGKVLATQGNFNNDIGLPLTLLRLEGDEMFAVIEIGANHHGEISYLTKIACPDVAIITNAGAAHLEGFGSVEGVANAKSEIFQGLNEHGCAVINADDHYADLWLEKTRAFKQICFAIESQTADVSAFNIIVNPDSSVFTLSMAGQSEIVSLPLAGLHNVSNALAAASAAMALGIGLKTIKQGLESFQGVGGRQKILNMPNGARLIDDTYNANLESAKAGIDVLRSYEGYKILVLGDLLEIGSQSAMIHEKIGEYAKQQGIDELLAIGNESVKTVQAFGQNGQHFQTKQELIENLKSKLSATVVAMVKGSRGMRMEEIINGVS